MLPKFNLAFSQGGSFNKIYKFYLKYVLIRKGKNGKSCLKELFSFFNLVINCVLSSFLTTFLNIWSNQQSR